MDGIALMRRARGEGEQGTNQVRRRANGICANLVELSESGSNEKRARGVGTRGVARTCAALCSRNTASTRPRRGRDRPSPGTGSRRAPCARETDGEGAVWVGLDSKVQRPKSSKRSPRQIRSICPKVPGRLGRARLRALVGPVPRAHALRPG